MEEGAIELLLRRRGHAALISAVTLSRPARMLAQDVEVELSDLASAAADAALETCDALRAMAPLAAEDPLPRSLLRRAERLRTARPGFARLSASPESTSSRAHPARPDAPGCGFELRDVDRHLLERRMCDWTVQPQE